MKGPRSLPVLVSGPEHPSLGPRAPSPAHRSWLAVGLLLVSLVLPAHLASAKIAVFVDGRILKVEDAYLEEDRIVLRLLDGGTMVVPAA